jgi:hypothetical protein
MIWIIFSLLIILYFYLIPDHLIYILINIIKITPFKILYILSYILSFTFSKIFLNSKKKKNIIEYLKYLKIKGNYDFIITNFLKYSIFSSLILFKDLSKYIDIKLDNDININKTNYLLGMHLGGFILYDVLENAINKNHTLIIKKEKWSKLEKYLPENNIKKNYSIIIANELNFNNLQIEKCNFGIHLDTYRKSTYKIKVNKFETSIFSLFPVLFKKFKKFKKDVYFCVIYFNFNDIKFIKIRFHKIGNSNDNLKNILNNYGKYWMQYINKYPEQYLWSVGNFLFKK